MNNKLLSLNVNDVSNIIYKDQIIKARVIDVYDGDTVTVIFMIENTPFKINIRLLGIDTPEIRWKLGKFKKEKLAAKKVRDYLSSLIYDTLIDLKIKCWDKYGGRMVGEIFVDGKSINEILIEKGYAKRYYGGKKDIWRLKELNKILKDI